MRSSMIKIYGMLEKFCTQLKTPEGKTLYAQFKERLFEVREETRDGMGFWGRVESSLPRLKIFLRKRRRIHNKIQVICFIGHYINNHEVTA